MLFASIWLFGLIFHLIVGSIGFEPMKTKANRFTVYPVCHFGNYPFCGSRRIQTSEAFQLASLAKRWYRSLTHTSNMRPTRCLGETTAFPLYFGRYSFCVAYQRIELWFPPWKGDDLTVSRIRHLLRYKDWTLNSRTKICCVAITPYLNMREEKDSNPRQSGLESDVLPTELSPLHCAWW